MNFPARQLSDQCLCCGSAGMVIFYESEKVPIISPVRAHSRKAARSYRPGMVSLGFCESCGFIQNISYEPALVDYTQPYTHTQSFSPTFNTFSRDLAQRLIENYDLRGKEIVDIGCGRGEFLFLLCQLGGNRGTGIDPAGVPGDINHEASERLTFIPEYFSDKHDLSVFDLVCCRHTLEHISRVGDFIRSVRRSLGRGRETVAFFQMPDVSRILREAAFWDISYEHCSYFSPGSLARLFRRSGFEVLRLEKAFDDRFLLIEARPADGPTNPFFAEEEDLESLARDVTHFTNHVFGKIEQLKTKLESIYARGQRVVIWVADTKTGVFLNTLGIMEEIEFAVDINPLLHGMYIPGTGQKIVEPEFLKEYRPDVVVVMNPIYQNEIREMLARMSITAETFSP